MLFRPDSPLGDRKEERAILFTRGNQIVTAILIGLCLIGAWGPPLAFSQPRYAIVDLGTLGGDTSLAYGLNEEGGVAGKSRTADGSMKAFFWDENNGMVDIGLGEAWGTNNIGQVVGNIHHHTDDAFIWDLTNGLKFLNKGDYLFATAYGVSDSGLVVGYARRFNDVDGTQAVVWDSVTNTIESLSALDSPSYAQDINQGGDVVGRYGSPSRAFVWNSTDGARDLGMLNGEEGRYVAAAITSGGRIVGYTRTESNEYKAFLWEPGSGMQALPGDGDSLAYGINQHGHIVGAGGTMIGLEGKAYLWKDGQRIDLNDTLPFDSGWELREARDINDQGRICGTGLIGGEFHAFLMTPVSSSDSSSGGCFCSVLGWQ